MSLETWVNIVASLMQVAAIIVGGIWTYRRFVRGRSDEVRAIVKNEVTQISLSKDLRYIRVVVEIRNIGTVVIKPPKGHTSIQRVMPVDKVVLKQFQEGRQSDTIETGPPEIDWEVLEESDYDLQSDEIELEPDESIRIPMDFVIPSSVTAVQVHTMIYCDRSADPPYWDDTVIEDFSGHT